MSRYQSLKLVKNQVTFDPGQIDFYPTTSTRQNVNDITAMRVSAVSACVERICVIESLPKHIYQDTPDGQKRVDHPYWKLLNAEPNRLWTASSFWERMISAMLLKGDGYAEIIRAKNQFGTQPAIVAIKPLIRESVSPSEVDGELVYKISDPNGPVRNISQDDILHVPGFGFDGFHGMSVIKYAARSATGIALAADKYSSAFFENGARPDFAIEMPNAPTPEQQEMMRQSWSDRYQGSEKSHKPVLLTGGSKIHEITMSAEDSQLLETRKYQVVDICSAFGVPPQLIGSQDSTAGWAGSSLEQLNLWFAKYTLRQHIARITQEINRKLFSHTKYFVEFNLNAFLEGDSKAQAEYFTKAIGGPGSQGWMTVNEVRRLKNMQPDQSHNGAYDEVIQSGATPPTDKKS
jgi:HK97 family phage portal protein